MTSEQERMSLKKHEIEGGKKHFDATNVQAAEMICSFDYLSIR